MERGRGTDAVPAIVKVNRGRLEILQLDGVPHSQVAIPNEPSSKAMLEFDPQQMYAITDVKHHNGEIFVTGISNQRFASTLHRIPYPFAGTMATSTVEIWHPVHAEFETRAPIIRQLIREVHGEPYLFAVYGCTPLVRFSLSSLKDGAHVRGDLIGELGYGSNPLDMLTFTTRPTRTVNSDLSRSKPGSVILRGVGPDLVKYISTNKSDFIASAFRVSVVQEEGTDYEALPDISGRYRVGEDKIEFVPHFPFEAGLKYRATFNARAVPDFAAPEVASLEFSFSAEQNASPTEVSRIFPSGDLLPENLLRIYVCFSNSLQRGTAEGQISLL